MIRKCILFTLIFLLLSGIASAQADPTTEGIVYIDGQNVDARVKLREMPNGKIIGQYYAGTHYTADKEKDGWVHVTIGGRTGWMMSSFLQECIPTAINAPVGRIAFPESDGCISLTDLDGNEHRISEDTLLYVLGTIDETYVHVEAHPQDHELLYGDCIMEKISWSDNLAHARVLSDQPDMPVNVREAPDINSKSLCKLYPSTEVQLIFDYHNSGDGWHRIRTGSISGYIRDDYLDFSTDGALRFIPQWGILKQPNAIVTGCDVGNVNQADPLFILGTAGNKNTPLYYCEGGTWVDEYTYQKIYFFIQQAYVEESGKGSISTKARTNAASGTQLYRFNNEQQIVPDEEIAPIPEGTEISILRSLDQDGNPTGWGQYLTEDTFWVQCEVPVGDQNYYGWLISVDDLSFDPRLKLPSMWTEG